MAAAVTCRLASGLLATAVAVAGPATPASAQASAAAASVQWDAFYQLLVSALRVDTGQRSADGGQVGTAFRSGAEAAASAVEQQQQVLQVVRAQSRYAYESGQGYRACMVAPGVAGIGRAMAQRDVYAGSLAARDDRWFEEGGDARVPFSALLGLRSAVYCSPAEQAALGGWCNPDLGRGRGGGYPAGNSDAGVFALNRGYGTEEAMTALDYVDTMAPLPTVPPPGGGEAGGARERAIHAGAFVSAARANLGQVVLDGLQDTRPTAAAVVAGLP